MKTIFTIIILLAPTFSYSKTQEKEEGTRKPAEFFTKTIDVVRVPSELFRGEKWVDKLNNVVCYSSYSGASSGGISCVKVDQAQ